MGVDKPAGCPFRETEACPAVRDKVDGVHYSTKELVEGLHSKFDTFIEKVDDRFDRQDTRITKLWVAVFSVAGAVSIAGTVVGIAAKLSA